MPKKSRKLSEYEVALIEWIGPGLAGYPAAEKGGAELEARAIAGDKLAREQIRFYCRQGLRDAYNRHWHSKLVSIVTRAGTAAVHLMQGAPLRDPATGKPRRGAIQTALFDFETEDDLRMLRLRIDASVIGGQHALQLVDAVIDIRQRHPGKTGREAAALEGLDPDAYTLDLTKYV